MADNSLFGDPSDTPQAQTPVHPSFWHGLMAGIQSGAQKLNSGLENMPANPLYNVGLGLMSAAKPFGNVGDSLQQSQAGMLQNRAAMQNYAINRYALQKAQQLWPIQKAIAEAVPGWLGLMGGQQGQQQSASPQGAPPSQGMPSQPMQNQPISMGQPQSGPAPQAGPSQGSGFDPQALMKAGMGLGLIGMPGGDGMMQLGEKLGYQYNPAFQTQMKTAESPVSIDMELLKRYGNNPAMANALGTKLQQDLGNLKISEFSGTRTTYDPNSNQWSTVDPRNMTQITGNQASLLPGATRAIGAKAAAEAQGKATGETTEVTDDLGNEYTVPKSSVLGAANAGKPPQATIGPGRKTLLTNQATAAHENYKEMQDQADASNMQLAQIEDLKSVANDFTPGKFAESRGEMLNYLNSAGLISDTQKNALGSYQQGQKIAIQLQATATKALGSREAAQIFNVMGKSIPNLTMSQDGLSKVSSFMSGIARYNIARATLAQQRYNAGDTNGVNATKDEFYQKTNPLFYVLASSDPKTRKEMLQSAPNPQKVIADWTKAYKAGFAPAPNDFQ